MSIMSWGPNFSGSDIRVFAEFAVQLITKPKEKGEKEAARRHMASLLSRAEDELSVFNVFYPWSLDSAIVQSSARENEILAVTSEDLKHLSDLVEATDDGPAWIQMMDKTMPNMSYKAWRRDPESTSQYRSRTVFEDATPELVRDFFWDDDFRIKSKWDDMLLYHASLKECPVTGTMLVHWVRKFPFFCSDRGILLGVGYGK
ncbi:hypothetical protein HPP92_020577 [Vanilla planifolia]|uniref:START domain-containing protein n=1 Tax=Vanilla planifolia TaxID=51239 RepID=A0A835UJX1_VANPL|nr:hypothetical protein HPP92_020577 [Vanilla planifolia]